VILAATLGALLVVAAGLGLALSDAGASTSAVVASGCGSTNPRLTVQGTGQASGTPDVLTAVFGFSTTNGSSASALAATNAKVSQALAALAAKRGGSARRPDDRAVPLCPVRVPEGRADARRVPGQQHRGRNIA